MLGYIYLLHFYGIMYAKRQHSGKIFWSHKQSSIHITTPYRQLRLQVHIFSLFVNQKHGLFLNLFFFIVLA